MAINGDMASLVGFVCEAFFYGCNTVLFSMAIYPRLNSPGNLRGVNRALLIIATLLYSLCTAHFTLAFIHFYDALNTTGVKGFSNIKGNLVVASFLVLFTSSLSELILVYRCWVLWSKNYWVVLLPTLAAIASLVSGTVSLHLLLSITQSSSVAPALLVPLDLAGFIIQLCGNAIVTTLIITRIWYLSPRRRRDVLGANFPTGTGRAAIAIIIESGMLYFSVQLVYCILFSTGSHAVGVIGEIAVQIYGIAPSLIFIRMSGLLNPPLSGRINNGPVISASQPVLTKLNFVHTTTTSTGPGLVIEMHEPGVEWKPSGGDLGSNPSFVDSGTAV